MRVLEWCDARKSAAAPYGGGSSVAGGVEPPRATLSRRGFDRSAAISTKCSRWTGFRARRESRPACMAPRWTISCGRTATRCAIFRSRLNFRRSADGSRRARAGISRRYTRISTTSSNRCGWSRRPESSSRAACRVRARVPVPTACLSGRKARSGLSPKRGCACRIGRLPRRRVGAISGFSRPAPMPCARFRRPDSIRRIAACSIRARRPTRARATAKRSGAGAGVRIRRPSAGRLDEAGAGMLRRLRRQNSRGRGEDPHR